MLYQALSYVLTALIPTTVSGVLYYLYKRADRKHTERLKTVIRQELTLGALEIRNDQLKEEIERANMYITELERKIVSDLGVTELNDVIRGLYENPGDQDTDTSFDSLSTEFPTAGGSKPNGH